MVFFQTSFPNYPYNNARTLQLVLVNNDLGGATSQWDSLLGHTFCTARVLSSNTIQRVNYFSVLSLTASHFVESHIFCFLQFKSLNRCSNNQSFYFHYYVVFTVTVLQFKQFMIKFTMDFQHFTVKKAHTIFSFIIFFRSPRPILCLYICTHVYF